MDPIARGIIKLEHLLARFYGLCRDTNPSVTGSHKLCSSTTVATGIQRLWAPKL